MKSDPRSFYFEVFLNLCGLQVWTYHQLWQVALFFISKRGKERQGDQGNTCTVELWTLPSEHSQTHSTKFGSHVQKGRSSWALVHSRLFLPPSQHCESSCFPGSSCSECPPFSSVPTWAANSAPSWACAPGAGHLLCDSSRQERAQPEA